MGLQHPSRAISSSDLSISVLTEFSATPPSMFRCYGLLLCCRRKSLYVTYVKFKQSDIRVAARGGLVSFLSHRTITRTRSCDTVIEERRRQTTPNASRNSRVPLLINLSVDARMRHLSIPPRDVIVQAGFFAHVCTCEKIPKAEERRVPMARNEITDFPRAIITFIIQQKKYKKIQFIA